ncbi:MAG TPA: hypothetical protein PLY86_18750 [bacterium]|nr:hypothetical protein [bacterium]
MNDGLYVLFNEAVKQPVVLPFKGDGPPVLLAWQSRDRGEGFLKSLSPKKRSTWRLYIWTCQDVSEWLQRNSELAGVEWNSFSWPAEGGTLVARAIWEGLGESSGNNGDLR